ncbi:MAG TPA: hypothetical protein VFZ17_00070 [Acidimicrobiia bacterium]|nr:hypothetical protein [Acidimicrobiia bacterium]
MDREPTTPEHGDLPLDRAGAAFIAELGRYRIGAPLRVSDELASYLSDGAPRTSVALDDAPVIDLTSADADERADERHGVIVPLRHTRRRTRYGVASAAVVASIVVLGMAQVLPAAAQSVFSRAASAVGIEIGAPDTSTKADVDAGSADAPAGGHAKDPTRVPKTDSGAADVAPPPDTGNGAPTTAVVGDAAASAGDTPSATAGTDAPSVDAGNGNGDENGVGNDGTPPGQRDDTTAPEGTPPGQGGLPPGHGGTPPGQTKKPNATDIGVPS